MSREAAGWLYVRLSGIALLFLVLGHVFFMHLLIVNRIDFALVAARWSGLGWHSYGLVMLLLAMPHAALGLRSLAFDHLRGTRAPPLRGRWLRRLCHRGGTRQLGHPDLPPGHLSGGLR